MEDHFTATKETVVNYKKISTPGMVPNIWIGFTYIRSEDYELYQNFNDSGLKRKPDHTSNNKVKIFAKLLSSLRKNGLMIRI